nr:RecName: Full=Turritoxin F21-2; AltName: Full=Turripeptide F21-2 [Polystira nobilis]
WFRSFKSYYGHHGSVYRPNEPNFRSFAS